MPVFVIETQEDCSNAPFNMNRRSVIFIVVAKDELSAMNQVNERGDSGTEITQVVGPIEDAEDRIVESFVYCE